MSEHRIASLCLTMIAFAGPAAPEWFADVASRAGLRFVHYDGRGGRQHYVETTASGGGFIDIDADGDLDVYLVNGAPTPGSPDQTVRRNALFENRGGRFVDVTAAAGVGDTAYGLGVCAGDIDADGKVDFLVTNYGPDRLYRNRGKGVFEEIAAGARVAGDGFSSGCAFGDLDGDGDLDLYVSRYVQFDFAAPPPCGQPSIDRGMYCRPGAFAGMDDLLYLNRGDGTFVESGLDRGLDRSRSDRGLGVVVADLDGDGDLDVYVANDGSANRLYENDGRGHFEDVALWSGSAVNALGQPEASMGVDAGDADGDGRLDLFVTHFALETNTLYRSTGDQLYADVGIERGVSRPSVSLVGWGTKFLDYDNDGDLDLAVANGHIEDRVQELEPSLRYAQPNSLFENSGDGHFREVTPQAGQAWSVAKVSRGLAVGDWNNDGRLDVLVTNTNDAPQLLENRFESANHWLGLELSGSAANPLAIGARVVVRYDDRTQIGDVRSGGSFLSQSDLRLHFGLGAHALGVDLDVRWPDGRHQAVRIDTLDRYHRVIYSPD